MRLDLVLYSIAHCKLSKTVLGFGSGLINLNYTFHMRFKVSPKAKSIINGASSANFMMAYFQRILYLRLISQAFYKREYDKINDLLYSKCRGINKLRGTPIELGGTALF